eukprot:4210071-Lingulodinium_polyedra.AAC.1
MAPPHAVSRDGGREGPRRRRLGGGLGRPAQPWRGRAGVGTGGRAHGRGERRRGHRRRGPRLAQNR